MLDVSLPGLGGIELQGQLHEMRETMPIGSDRARRHSHVRTGDEGGRFELSHQAGERDRPLQGNTPGFGRGSHNAGCARRESDRLRQRLALLTLREREVFKGIAAGKLNKQIAGDLGIVEQTVKFHRAHIMERMQAHTTAELMRMAAKLAIGDKR